MAQSKLTKANIELFKSILSFAQEHQAKVEEIKDALTEYHDEKSDKWRDGDKGSELSAIIDTIGDIDIAFEALETSLEEVPGIND